MLHTDIHSEDSGYILKSNTTCKFFFIFIMCFILCEVSGNKPWESVSELISMMWCVSGKKSLKFDADPKQGLDAGVTFL